MDPGTRLNAPGTRLNATDDRMCCHLHVRTQLSLPRWWCHAAERTARRLAEV